MSIQITHHSFTFYQQKFTEIPFHWLSFHCTPPERSELADMIHFVWMPLPEFGCFINMTQSVFICNILTTWVHTVDRNGKLPQKIHSSARLKTHRKQTAVSSCEMFAETFISFFCGWEGKQRQDKAVCLTLWTTSLQNECLSRTPSRLEWNRQIVWQTNSDILIAGVFTHGSLSYLLPLHQSDCISPLGTPSGPIQRGTN